ncbi:MAG TPA: monooxygenase [Zeimonas sp.]|nr:monooxygenase [Zeimonas sp.]
MSAILVHIRFPHQGPWGQQMVGAYAGLARSIADEPGLLWKLWLEDEAAGRAGGAYLFANRTDAERYLQMHRERLAGWGIVDLDVSVSEVNATLSVLSGAASASALGAGLPVAASVVA